MLRYTYIAMSCYYPHAWLWSSEKWRNVVWQMGVIVSLETAVILHTLQMQRVKHASYQTTRLLPPSRRVWYRCDNLKAHRQSSVIVLKLTSSSSSSSPPPSPRPHPPPPSSSSSSSSSIGTTAHCGLWPVEQCPSIFSYLTPTLSIFSLPALEDLFLLPLSILSWSSPSSRPFQFYRG